MSDSILRRFGLTESNRLGEGGESRVYALDGERVLRVCPGDVSSYVERRREFYRWLNGRSPAFEVPLLLSVDFAEGVTYCIERRMKGRDFGKVLGSLEAEERERALTSYLDVAGRIGDVRLPGELFGELIADDPVRSESWPDFLWRRAQKVLEVSYRDVEADVPEFRNRLEDFRNELRLLEGFREKSLVHGDYFPNNVFIDDGLRICGAGDFSYATLVGDRRMDLAGALAYLELSSGYRPEDTALLTHLLNERYGAGIGRFLRLYRLYYSIYYSFLKKSEPGLYRWCIRNIRNALRR
jgi:putative membrane protein